MSEPLSREHLDYMSDFMNGYDVPDDEPEIVKPVRIERSFLRVVEVQGPVQEKETSSGGRYAKDPALHGVRDEEAIRRAHAFNYFLRLDGDPDAMSDDRSDALVAACEAVMAESTRPAAFHTPPRDVASDLG